MDRAERIARNLAIAEKFYDGYHHSVERGELVHAFDPDDFAESWVFCSPFLGGETLQARSPVLAQGAAANHAVISQRIPDYKMDDFRAWPTERGCAWRWRVNGHGIDGNAYEFWEQLFVWTDDDGKVTRFEFFDDWHGFPQTLEFAYEQSLDEFTKIDHYGRPPFNPGPTMTIASSVAPPYDTPPANGRVARNLEIARKLYDAYHESVTRGSLVNAFDPADFADSWVIFSPWMGEIQQVAESGYTAVADVEHQKIWNRLPDYKMDDFEAWPTDDGCAWRWRVNGHTADGTYYEFWEQMFADIDADGKVTRFEFFDDWQGFPPTLGFITGLTVDELWDVANYGAWIGST